MSLRFEISKRGEIWSCCDRWHEGVKCHCAQYIVEWYVHTPDISIGTWRSVGAAHREGPRPSDPRIRT